MTTTAARRTIRPRTFAAILGALAVLASLLLLFLPLSTSVNGNAVACGSAAVANQHAMRSSAFEASLASIDRGDRIAPIAQAESACASARHARADFGWALLGVGVVVVAGARFVRWSR